MYNTTINTDIPYEYLRPVSDTVRLSVDHPNSSRNRSKDCTFDIFNAFTRIILFTLTLALRIIISPFIFMYKCFTNLCLIKQTIPEDSPKRRRRRRADVGRFMNQSTEHNLTHKIRHLSMHKIQDLRNIFTGIMILFYIHLDLNVLAIHFALLCINGLSYALSLLHQYYGSSISTTPWYMYISHFVQVLTTIIVALSPFIVPSESDTWIGEMLYRMSNVTLKNSTF